MPGVAATIFAKSPGLDGEDCAACYDTVAGAVIEIGAELTGRDEICFPPVDSAVYDMISCRGIRNTAPVANVCFQR